MITRNKLRVLFPLPALASAWSGSADMVACVGVVYCLSLGEVAEAATRQALALERTVWSFCIIVQGSVLERVLARRIGARPTQPNASRFSAGRSES